MGGTRKKVLWVDDEIEFLRAHIMFLETRGYTVKAVYSGDDALHLIRENPKAFDIVLLDEHMPGKNGLATLEEIKEIIPEMPVVMVTKSEEERVMDDALGRKIDAYLTKPVNPSQILSVCKKILESKEMISTQLTQKFVRSYSDTRYKMSVSLTAKDWTRIYENLVMWDIELEKDDDEGLRQSHAGQKSDCNAAFSAYVAGRYGRWLRGQDAPPNLSPDIIERFIYPLLAAEKKVYFVVLDSMRLDQYVGIETLLKRHFEVERHYYYSILPTATPFARNALFAGAYPQDIAAEYPDLWKKQSEDEDGLNRHESSLLAAKCAKLGIPLKKKVPFISMLEPGDSRAFLTSMPDFKKDMFVSIVVKFVDMLTHSRATSAILQEIAPDESAFRSLTQSWFQYSTLYQIFKAMAAQDCMVVLTADHGSVLCTRPTDLYGTRAKTASLRYKFGENISCDERHAIHLPDPAVFRLPRFSDGTRCAIAMENYYFVYPDKSAKFAGEYLNTFQSGGVSMEEMIVPLAVMRPKAL
jgi:CheY-like chemotaxis protein